ncbi:MAG: ECF transporter S component [Erysipelotrichales bacterium]
MKFTTKDIVYIGIFSTLVMLGTFINFVVPFAPNGGLVHLGTTVSVIALIVAGPRVGTISGALGMTLFDILGGWAIWAPATFIGRYGLGFLMAKFAFKNEHRGESLKLNAIGLVVGGAWMVFVYYLYEAIIYSNFITPIASISANVLQLIVAAVIGLPLGKVLRKFMH